MTEAELPMSPATHSHVFLGQGHEANERRTWWVIALCGAMMLAEIVGGALFGSIALVADGLHMSTHAGALLLAALSYSYARRHAADPRFSFGTGKLGDLAGFSSAMILAMIALLIGYEAMTRFIAPVAIHFGEAIPIACLGLVVNVASVWLLSGSPHHEHHHHGHGGQAHDDHSHAEEEHRLALGEGAMLLQIHEDGDPPRFRAHVEDIERPPTVTVETERHDGTRQLFRLVDRGHYMESDEQIPEPHAFIARVRVSESGEVREHTVTFKEHEHAAAGAAQRDNNMRAAIIHVMADAAVSMLVILGLSLAGIFGWLWMDPLAGIIGAFVIASWSYGLIGDTGAVLLDMTPDQDVAQGIRQAIEAEGDQLADLHVWRLGPGHLGAIVSVITRRPREPQFYRDRLLRFRSLAHVTVEVQRAISPLPGYRNAS
ncbi:MAG: CDF family Co(II)/Ni(II) efflux transporter DmeF [Pseudomonadota bacterium]|nr:CDF family Co(II)/Ni(II) efflux transporter DmeF [Pseudomonadota bacterium]